jgi:predicted Zn finger-like uncharacterized protein
MLKVECESCKAPYQIDERRVPPAGLKMRCPKCGHSFLVTNPNGPGAAAPAAPKAGGPAAPRPPVPSALKSTMVGVAPPPPPVAAAPPRPAPAAPAPAPPPVPGPPPAPLAPIRDALPSDFPAALGALDESDLPVISPGLPALSAGLPATRGASPATPAARPPPPPAAKKSAGFGDIDLDLPIVAADNLPAVAASNLPTAKRAPHKAPPAPARGSFDLDLPAAVSNLPSVRHGGDADLPVVSAGLPVPAAGLPAVAADLPSNAASLPVAAASLPVAASALPVLARGFGEIDLPDVAQVLPNVAEILPNVAEILPSVPAPGQAAQASAPPTGAFGEIELPRERGSTSSAPPPPHGGVVQNSADFGDLQLGDNKPRSGRIGGSAVGSVDAASEGGGMTFGEVDFGGGDGRGASPTSIGVDRSGVSASQPPSGGPTSYAPPKAAASTSVRPPSGTRDRLEAAPPGRRYGKLVAGGIFIAAVLGGAALQLTSLGAFGYMAIGDAMHASDYARATSGAMADAEKALGTDTYDGAKSATDAVFTAHTRTPRARPLTAYAAVIDAATAVRFGADPSRTAHVKQLLAELPPGEPVKYVDVATAAQAAVDADLDKARRGLDAASKRDTGDPIQLDVALLRGEIELAARDAAAALGAFKHALELSDDARAHFGLARTFQLMGDAPGASKEVGATLAASPLHPGALTLRARLKVSSAEDAQSLEDLAKVIEGPAHAKASPDELSRAYVAKALIDLRRGAASDAREAFGQAVKLTPRNIEALNGEGRLLLNDGRFTEALTRFDTALQYDATSPETIANDAEAKIALERLADAKQQLLDAKQKFPKNIPLILLLGKVEQHLGNKDAAEADLRSAVSFVDPTSADAVLPYVALSELLSARGRLPDAAAVLEDARKTLPPSAALDRAFGEVAELQGDYDAAIADYKTSIAKDPKDVVTHFRLAVVLRRIRKFDAAGPELDHVAAVDKDYPGLSLERGLLFEESGDVEKAIDQFKGALAKAPDDPDLQLRVGSAYVAIGRPDDALVNLRKVLQKRPTSAEANHYIGRALMLKGRSDQPEALRYLKKAVDLDPNRAEFHVYLAWSANDAQTPQLELARDEIKKALDLDKMNPEAYWQKGVLDRMQGAIDDAIRAEHRALALRPSRYEAHATLAECFEDKNDEASAASEWTKAIAGDGNTLTADGTVPHPFWRYKFGKLLMDHGNAGPALAQLVPAAAAAEKMDPRPGWLGPVEFLTAEALRKAGRKADAIEHYRRYLEVAPVNSPDRADAQAALTQLSGAH